MTARLLLLPLLAGCTFTPGSAFTHVESASLTASLEPGVARDLGGGAFLTSEGFEVTPSVAILEVASVSLQAVEGTAGDAFDPANPPDGYSLCHAGHCHHADGRLVPYAEIEIELSGGSARLVDVLAFRIDDERDLLAGTTTPLTVETPDLGAGDVTLLSVDATAFTLVAEVVDGDGDTSALAVELPLSAPITAGIAVTIDRDFPATVDLALSLSVDATLLDGLDLSDDAVVTDPDSEAGRAILDALTSQVPTLLITEPTE